jgi:hypothetical protein
LVVLLSFWAYEPVPLLPQPLVFVALQVKAQQAVECLACGTLNLSMLAALKLI